MSSETMQMIFENLANIVLAILGPLLIIIINNMASRYIRKVDNQMDLNVKKEAEAFIRALTKRGIYYAEERARKAMKLESELPSDEKRAIAKTFIKTILEHEQKDHKYSDEQLDALIESELGELREYYGSSFGTLTKKGDADYELEESK